MFGHRRNCSVEFASGKGYLLVGADGGVFSFGGASYEGSLPGQDVHVSNIVGIAATPDGRGYWLVGADGGVFAFGSAQFKGSIPGLGDTHLASSTWLRLRTKGAIGSWVPTGECSPSRRPFDGSIPGTVETGAGSTVSNIVGMAVNPNGQGYLLVGADDHVTAFCGAC